MRPQQQRSQMMSWAEQKVRTDSPEAQGKTLTMIMRAEPRTTTAIMHAKSPAQTREVIIAAYKRAGLPSPFHGNKTEDKATDMHEVVEAIATQTKITSDVAKILKDVPRGKHYEELVTYMRDSQVSSIQAVESLAKTFARLESTMATWEKAYLPQLVGHPQPRPPATTPQAMDTGTEAGTQDYASVPEGDGFQHGPTAPEQPVTHEPCPREVLPRFERIQT